MSKAIDLARKCRLFDDDQEPLPEHLEAFYAAAEAAGEKKVLDRLTAGVEMPDHPEPRAYKWSELEKKAILEYGAAQRLLGAREEREGKETFEQAWQRKKDEGYQYGRDALEQVRFGFKIARDEA